MDFQAIDLNVERLKLWSTVVCCFVLVITDAVVGLSYTLLLMSLCWKIKVTVNRLANACTRGSISIQTLGYMRMNFSRQFSRTIIDHETVCKAVLILQQQR